MLVARVRESYPDCRVARAARAAGALARCAAGCAQSRPPRGVAGLPTDYVDAFVTGWRRMVRSLSGATFRKSLK